MIDFNNLNNELTNKQLKILKYSAEGLTEEAMALKLEISVNTIKYHKRGMYDQLCVNNIIEAIIKALKNDLIILEEINV